MLSFLQRLFEHYWDRAVDFTDEEPRSAPGPTEIEHDVLLLMAAGKKDEAIAHQLGMSPRSVSRIVARLMERLDAASRFTERPSDDEMASMLDARRMTSLFGLPT